jgi:CheY-like chemotaxis protein
LGVLAEQSLAFARSWVTQELPKIFDELDALKEPADAIARDQQILIVDDHRDMTRLLRHAFERNGYTVRIAHNAQAAIEAIRRERPDLVLLDIMMPGQDGFWVLEAIRADPECTGTRVVVLSARPESVNKERALELGACGYVSKTDGLEAIERCTEEVLCDKR